MAHSVLVSGGAGYVGSHVCLALAEAGFEPVAYDNLSNGHADFVRWGALEQGDIRDPSRLDEVLAKHRPIAVVHCAAVTEVERSLADPGAFYDINVRGSVTLFEAARRQKISHLVYSSTCAVYGNPAYQPLDEAHPLKPVSPYGRSKLMVEQILSDYSDHAGLRSVSLRYFNAAGADAAARTGERRARETHVVPLALKAGIEGGAPFRLFGDDYDTRDGSSIRDYVHVMDLADAHVRALDYLISGGDTVALNLGTGAGTSVKELLALIQSVTGCDFEVETSARRPGDPASLVANNRLAKQVLDWAPQRTLTDIVESAWNWSRQEASRPPAIAPGSGSARGAERLETGPA